MHKTIDTIGTWKEHCGMPVNHAKYHATQRQHGEERDQSSQAHDAVYMEPTMEPTTARWHVVVCFDFFCVSCSHVCLLSLELVCVWACKYAIGSKCLQVHDASDRYIC